MANPYDELLAPPAPASDKVNVYDKIFKPTGDSIKPANLPPWGGLQELSDTALPGAVVQAGALSEALPNFIMAKMGRGDFDPNMSFGDAYRTGLARYRAAKNFYEGDNPGESKAARALGIGGSMVLFKDFGPDLAATPGRQVIQGAKTGAVYGGGTGAMNSDLSNPGETAANTATGALGGAAIGTAIPVAAQMVRPLAEGAARSTGLMTAEDQANRRLAAALVPGGGPQGAADRLNASQLPPWVPSVPRTVTDLGGSGTKSLAGTVYRSGGDAQQLMDTAFDMRDGGAGARLSQGISSVISGGGDPYTVSKMLDAAKSAQATPLYQQAYAANKSIMTPVISKILDTPLGQQALGYARNRMQNQMSLMAVPDPELTAAAKEASELGLMPTPPKGGVASGLKLQTLDYIKQGFDDAYAAKAVSDPAAAKDALMLKRGLVNELDNADTTAVRDKQGNIVTPGAYAQARSAWAGNTASQNAMEMGRKFLSMDNDEISDVVNNLEPAQRDYFMVGAAKALRDRVQGAADSADEGKALAKSQLVRDKITALGVSPDNIQPLLDQAKGESEIYGNMQAVRGGSQTAARMAADHGDTGLGPLGNMAAGVIQSKFDPMAGIPRALSAGKQWLNDVGNSASPEVNAALAKMLMSDNPQAVLDSLANTGPTPNIPGMLTAPVAGQIGPVLGALARLPGPAAPPATVPTYPVSAATP